LPAGRLRELAAYRHGIIAVVIKGDHDFRDISADFLTRLSVLCRLGVVVLSYAQIGAAPYSDKLASPAR
jgi:hypothetical protein